MAEDVDGVDRQILDVLAVDGRISIRALAERVHISRANAYARVERLRSSGVILGFRAEVSPEAVGLRTSAYVTLNLHQTEWRTVQQRLLQVPGVVHVALVGGEFDVVLLVRARDNADLRRVVLDEVQAIEGVTSTRTLLFFDESEPARHG
ncbi:Lrp/AsnC family transcriptional regulator [Nocardioides eburneiflavus]|uniref:Lrp/AsnC family transcriptional regulator n=1 Tax=Nocardioides eburneiflavus TaxID=2518372 RepID=A0A4Z1C498_9ACTN|nr:Lrp/AsnC family transcriptional regulator [Nocardioides eburneiflavus]TGN65114.1 Lrp/AsnC family transcriptional regulator [Nocardioides eburneiflavus]